MTFKYVLVSLTQLVGTMHTYVNMKNQTIFIKMTNKTTSQSDESIT